MNQLMYTLLAALLVAAVCSRPETRRTPKPQDIINILNYLKRHAHEIDPHLGLGPLDPLTFAHAALDIVDDEFQLKGFVENVQVVGVRELEFDTPVIIPLWNYTLSLRLSRVVINGTYGVDGIIGNVFPLYGSGPFSIVVEDLSILARLLFGVESSTMFMYIRHANTTLSVGAVKTRFGNLLGGGETGDIMNDVISEMIPTLLTRRMGQILDLLENKVIIDGFLSLFPNETMFDFQKRITKTDWSV